MKFFKGIFRTKRSSQGDYEGRTKYYTQNLESKLTASFFAVLMSGYCKNESSFATETTFKAKSEFDLGSSRESILESWGEPAYYTTTKHLFKHDILLYRTLVGGLKAKYELHFVNDSLFSFSLKFSYLNAHQQENLINTLGYKYLKKRPLPSTPFKIFDQKNNMLSVERRSDLTFTYLSGDDEQQNLVELALDMKSAKTEQRTRKREMELIYCL